MGDQWITERDPAPKPLFRLNADLNPGQITQVDYAANGADVNVQRTVIRDGTVVFQDTVQTRYEAWQAVCEYSRGMKRSGENGDEKDATALPASIFLAW